MDDDSRLRPGYDPVPAKGATTVACLRCRKLGIQVFSRGRKAVRHGLRTAAAAVSARR